MNHPAGPACSKCGEADIPSTHVIGCLAEMLVRIDCPVCGHDRTLSRAQSSMLLFVFGAVEFVSSREYMVIDMLRRNDYNPLPAIIEAKGKRPEGVPSSGWNQVSS